MGVGWCCINIASTALISDLVAPSDRGRAIGTNDTIGGAAAVVLPLLGGPIVEAFGLPSVALISTGLMLIPFVMLLRLEEGRMGGRDQSVPLVAGHRRGLTGRPPEAHQAHHNPREGES